MRQFIGLSGMGHDLPRAIWGSLQDDICAVAGRATAATGSAVG